MIRQQDKKAFWAVVRDCLVEIYGLSRSSARTRSKRLRDVMERAPERHYGDIFYHAEPFDVACDVAGKSLDLSQYRARYDAILNRHNW